MIYISRHQLWNSSTMKLLWVLTFYFIINNSKANGCLTAGQADIICTCSNEDAQCDVQNKIDSMIDVVGTDSVTRYRNVDFRPVSAVNGDAVTKWPRDVLSKIAIHGTLRVERLGLSALELGSLRTMVKEIKRILFTRNSITVIPEGLFDDTPMASSIDFEGNAISSITSGVFKRLPNLYAIILRQNKIRLIDSNAFTELPSLRELDLSYNQISVVDTHFQGLSNLESLNLDSNGPANSQLPLEIADDALTGLKSLQTLYLSGNRLSDMPKLGSMPSALYLYLGNNFLPFLPNDSFVNVPNLQQLYLNNNTMQWIPTNTFHALEKLVQLEMKFNTIPYVHANAFRGLASLTRVDFTSAGVERISNSAFDDISDHLTYVGLTDNRLETLCYAPFRCLQNANIRLVRNRFTCNCAISWFRNLNVLSYENCAFPNRNEIIFSFSIDPAECPLFSADMDAVCRGTEFYDCSGQASDHFPVDENVAPPRPRPPQPDDEDVTRQTRPQSSPTSTPPANADDGDVGESSSVRSGKTMAIVFLTTICLSIAQNIHEM